MKVVIVRGHDLKAKFRAALVGVAAEDGIEEDEVDVKFVEEKPNDWPSSGSYDATSALINSYPKGTSYMRDLFVPPFGEAAGSCCRAAGKGSACTPCATW